MKQQLIPGVVGISTYVDFVYQEAMQGLARERGTGEGPINQLVSVTVTLDFLELVDHVVADRLDRAEQQVAAAVERLEKAGASFAVVTSGTTSTLTALARERTSIRFLDLAATTWAEVGDHEVIGLLSTRRTITGGQFHELADRHQVRILTPNPSLAARVDEAIFGELVRGEASDRCVATLVEGIDEMAQRGAETIVLGNTDLSLVVSDLRDRSPLPLVDAARAHARAAGAVALDGFGASSRVRDSPSAFS